MKYKFSLAADHIVLRPEGAGAFALALIHEAAGQGLTDFSKRNVAVASWGYLTLSVIAFSQGKPVKGFYKSNSDVGMQRYIQRLANGYGNPIGVSELMWENLLFAQFPAIMGRTLEGFYDHKVSGASLMATNGLLFLGNSLTGMNIDTLLFTGGTAQYLDTLLGTKSLHFWEKITGRNSLPANIFISSEPETADAAGHFLQQAAKRENSL